MKSEQSDNDQNMAGLELCQAHEDLETICSIEGAKTRCLTVPIALSSGCGPGVEPDPGELDEDTKRSLAELKKGWHTSEAKLTWSLGEDGKITVKKASGDASVIRAGIVGTRPLAP